MGKSLLVLGLLAGLTAIAAPASAAVVTFTGVSTGVSDPDTGEAEQYKVDIAFDTAVTPFISHEITINAPYVPYDTGFYYNVLSVSVVGPRYSEAFTGGYSRVSTLATSRFRDGAAGFSVGAGSDGTTIGYSVNFNYFLPTAFASTAMPSALDIAAAFENGFNLTEYYYDGDPADEIITSRELLNFRFASGGFAPAAAVPEPSTWALMVVGFGLAGGALRYRRRRPGIAYG